MASTPPVERYLDEGIAALRRGDATRGRALLTAIEDDPRALFPLAFACGALGDEHAARGVLQRLLALQPDHIPALIMTGDIVARTDQRGAAAYYQAALVNAAAQRASLPPELQADLDRVGAVVAATSRDYGAFLHDHLAASGIRLGEAHRRVQHAIDLLTGQTEIFVQRPSSFYFPGLPQRAFFERAEFAWLPALEAATGDILGELRAVLAADGGFPPYVATPLDRPPPPNPLRDDPRWGAFHLLRAGAPVAGNADRCPATMAALGQTPMPLIAQRAPMALFSLLKPGTHITPHHGMLNTRLIVHLPLIAPPDCALRVGAETRAWRVGEALVFDDSIEHEAWNRGTTTRVVLLFEIWRPELTPPEREALAVLFGAVEAFVDQG
ncbi:aspartyl/asparaginyl beta-hydroxylase domain-containing protein [Sphingomonas sp. PAMC 26605]|uniref:aspartyl/asparaginyl beta-hydroxylase domain-containing protein n=1 Tax=Sphingomonas sp. PAMC 26605 TaxID=1112214 RepID=UPI00026CD14D|nr:aspartyl/asparaginyl beta-hydroxylase domain-containing protein [Sphingomonas sp. PAMC 26605]